MRKMEDPKKDPETYFRHHAMDLLCSFNFDELRYDSVVGATDIVGCRGVIEIELDEYKWPHPVLIAFSSEKIEYGDDDEVQAKAKARQAKKRQQEEIAQLRKGLAELGLEELACQDFSPTREYALVAQLADPEDDLARAARELAKLMWELAD